MREAVIVEAVRTPMGKGKPGGALSSIHPADLLGTTLRALVERAGVDPEIVEDVIAGCVGQAGEQSLNVARNAWLGAGLPESTPGTTVDRQCGSSQQTAHFAAQAVMSGAHDVVVAAGVESMSRVPMMSNIAGANPFGEGMLARYDNGLVPQGLSAEMIAAKWGITREQADEIGATSQERAAAAADAGRFDREIVPVTVTDESGEKVEVAADEGIRPGTTPEKLGKLSPSFYDENVAAAHPDIPWVVTAGNASQITDGAAAMLVMSRERADQLGLTPRARFHTFALAGTDPILMLTGPIPATRKALERAGLGADDIDHYEINEAFATVVAAWHHEVGADYDRVNPRGGAIALGHPLGASGARLMTTMLHALEDDGGRFGLQSMCEGGGLANATIIERLG